MGKKKNKKCPVENGTDLQPLSAEFCEILLKNILRYEAINRQASVRLLCSGGARPPSNFFRGAFSTPLGGGGGPL